MNIIVGQSGGPSAAINASLAGVIEAGIQNGKVEKVYGMLHGIDGLLHGKIVNITDSGNRLEQLVRTPAMALGSCRLKLPKMEENEEIYQKITQILQKYDIGCFYYIGGNDSMDTVDKLTRYFTKYDIPIQAIGIPKTVDNDLVCTDHTPGFGSAAKYLNDTMEEIICDACIYPVQNIIICEIMGRDSGWLTLAAGMPRYRGIVPPQIILLPETPFYEDQFVARCKELLKRDTTVVVVCSEGIRDETGEYVGMSHKSGAVDIFGHAYLSGVGKYLESLVNQHIGCKVRSIELNIMQRCSAHLASACDLKEARQVGYEAVKRSIEEHLTGMMFAYDRVSDTPYEMEIVARPVAEIANKAKIVPQKWWNIEEPQVQSEVRAYLEPLIQGEMDIMRKESGAPDYVIFYRGLETAP